jgi:hypothetical protein
MAVGTSVEVGFVAGHHFAFFPEQSRRYEYVERIIDSAFDVVLILDSAVGGVGVGGDFRNESIGDLFVPGNVQFRDDDID